MRTLTTDDLSALDKLVRVQLATSLPGVKPVALVASEDSSGTSNLAPFSSLVHLGSNPVLIGMVTRPDVVERHTLANILETRCWTVNHLHPGMIEAAHHCAARYPREVSEFDASGLAEERLDGVRAPFVAESRFRMALALEQLIDIPANGTKLVVGRVTHIQLADEFLGEDGSVDLPGLGLVASTALDTYFTISPLARLPYAKPKS